MAHDERFELVSNTQEARSAANRLFDQLKAALAEILPASAEILHIGATSVPGCLTKGDLDIVVRVPAQHFDAARRLLAQRYARNEGSHHCDSFAAFEDCGRVPHLGIQLTAKGGAFDHFHRFADALRSDAELLARYNDLKRDFDAKPMGAYRAAKAAFVADVLGQIDTPE